MWRKIGAQATIEVNEIAKHFELRSQNKLAPTAFGEWGNQLGDPRSSIGGAMYGAFPNSRWKTEDLDAMIRPLLNEKDEEKRLATTSRPTLHR